MADEPSNITASADTSLTRPRSPTDTGTGSERKRRRKVLSCYDCRRRKLQCDRVLPACGRCTKAGQASKCLYFENPTETPARPVAPSRPDSGSGVAIRDERLPGTTTQMSQHPHTLLARLEHQSARIRQLEAALAEKTNSSDVVAAPRLQPTVSSSAHRIDCEDVTAATDIDGETMLLRGKSFKTKYYGSTHPGTLIAHIPELDLFTKEALEQFSGLQKLRQDLHTFEDRSANRNSKSGLRGEVELYALLPPKDELDRTLRLYFDTYDCIYHIVHTPSFWKDYDEMWQSGAAQASTHFVALVLLMSACVSCLVTTKPWVEVAESFTIQEKAMTIIQACGAWIGRQSQKHVTALDFQIRCLLWLAKRTCGWKAKRTWTESGDLLRFCMSAGLHRDPDLLKKRTGAVEKELRRRVWATVVNIETQASFDRGMVSAPWLLQSDCLGPVNVDDESFTADQSPPSNASAMFTPSSYLCLAQKSTALRSSLNNTLNNVRHKLSFEEVKQYTDDIETYLRAIPVWTVDLSESPRALLVLQLLQYLLAIHDRFVRSAATRAERSFSKMIIVETNMRIIRTHQGLTDRKNIAMELLCQDQLRVSLSIAHFTSIADPRTDEVLGHSVDHVFPDLLEAAVTTLAEKLLRFARKQPDLWHALAATGFVKSKANPDSRTKALEEAIDRVSQPFYRIMSGQGHAAALDSNTPSGVLGHLPAGTNADDATDATNPALLDFDDLAAWTFDEWMFTPEDFGQSFADSYQEDAGAYADMNLH